MYVTNLLTRSKRQKSVFMLIYALMNYEYQYKDTISSLNITHAYEGYRGCQHSIFFFFQK